MEEQGCGRVETQEKNLRLVVARVSCHSHPAFHKLGWPLAVFKCSIHFAF
jgi:hypothetical protein